MICLLFCSHGKVRTLPPEMWLCGKWALVALVTVCQSCVSNKASSSCLTILDCLLYTAWRLADSKHHRRISEFHQKEALCGETVSQRLESTTHSSGEGGSSGLPFFFYSIFTSPSPTELVDPDSLFTILGITEPQRLQY